MATIYEKIVGDKVVILEPREACIRVPLASANPWTEMRIAVALSLTNVASSNGAYPAESFAVSTVYDRFAFGLKNGDTDDLPGVAGTRFWGALSIAGQTVVVNDGTFTTGMTPSFNNPGVVIAEGTSVAITGSGNSSWAVPTVAQAQASTLFARLFGLRLVINNRGLSSQTVQAAIHRGGTAVTDTSETALRSFLVGLSGWTGLTAAATANDGATAYDVPDAFFFRLPFITVRARLHNVMVMQAVP